jgi:hypothetical protein
MGISAENYRRYKQRLALIANTTLTKAEAGLSFSNVGATGTVVVQLPLDSVPGDVYKARVHAAQTLTIKCGAAGLFYLVGTVLTAGHGISSATPGDALTLECVGALTWVVRDTQGTHWIDQA